MKTILVVDDMAIFREPLAAMLRQRGFQVATAVNGQEALRVARQDPPDLILLDAAMPVMDGLTFCQNAQTDDRLRGIPIIMLTAIADRTVVQKAVQYGVEDYLLKTQFSVDELISRIDRQLRRVEAAATQSEVPAQHESPAPAPPRNAPAKSPVGAPDTAETITAERTLARVREQMQLRSIKPVLQHVLGLTCSASTSFDDIASAIRQDQALALKVMQVANSSFYRTGRPATSLREAEQRIGLSGIRNITTAILAINEFADANPAGIIPQRFWEHALSTALLSERIGERVDAPLPEDLFLAGLLHDLGRLVLSEVLSRHYALIIEQAASGDTPLLDLERECFQLTHVEVTRELLVHWKIPAHVIEAAVLHHQPVARIRQSAKNPLAVLSVALANALSHSLLLGDSGSGALSPLQELAEAVGIDARGLQQLTQDAVRGTTDTTFFYASRTEGRTLDSLANTLASSIRVAPRIWLPAPASFTLLPVELMVRQLGWVVDVNPRVALVGGETREQLERQLSALANLEHAIGAMLPTICISAGQPSFDAWGDRTVTHVTLPCRHQRLIDTLIATTRSTPVASA